MIYLFRKPEHDEYCVIGADPAEGNDNSTFVVISKRRGDVIMIGQSKEESPQLGHCLNHVGKYLKKVTGHLPLIAVERNVGSATIHVLKSLNYSNLFRMPDSFTKTDTETSEQYGWITSSATRPKMLDDLALAIRQQVIIIPSKLMIDELFTFIRNAKTGKPEADAGCTDDFVMALAIAWQVYQIAPNRTLQTENIPVTPYEPQDKVIGI